MMSNFSEILRAHAQRYPLMQPCDAVKLLYQHAMGGGHLITDVPACLHMLRTEYAALFPCAAPALEDIGNGRFRYNLAALNEKSLPLSCLCMLFVLSSEQASGRSEDFAPLIEVLRDAATEGLFSFNAQELDQYLFRYRRSGYPSVHHSDIYRRAYHPAYRVLDGKFTRLLPVIERINVLMEEKTHVVVAIDGGAASGKTTSAALLSQLYDTAVVHMDDFFLPFAMRTPERLAEPGGNIHYERFAQEVLPGLRYGANIRHRVFDCSTGEFSDERIVRHRPLTIVEGVYSHHPSLADAYTLRVFLSISAEEQHRRILQRNGADGAPAFFERWIPLENAYFEKCAIPSHSDIIIE